MKIAIVYYSAHHGNTKKLLDAIAKQREITLIDPNEHLHTDLSEYDLIGFASGIYYQKFHGSVLRFAKKYLPQNKKVFFIHTCGMNREQYTEAIQQIVNTKHAQILGSYSCRGFDTFGPFKLIGGIAKGHPNEEDVQKALAFFEQICAD